MTTRSSDHATFVIERTYDAAPARVFAAWASISAKQQWWGPRDGGEGHELDFRVGGREHFAVRAPAGVYAYDALYEDIVEGERIVYTYNMHLDGERMSVSVTTIDLTAVAEGTRLRYTEQGVYLDGLDTPAAREHGTTEMIDALAGALAAGAGV